MKRFPKAVYDYHIILHNGAYYKKWSERFKLLRMLSLWALVSALVISIVFFGDSMTYNNVQLLANVVDSEYNSVFSDDELGVAYDFDLSAVFCSYNKELVIATQNEVSLYNVSSGRELYSYSVSYENPKIVASDSLFIVYDLGNNRFSVYNKIGRIFDEQDCEYAIVNAAVSDSGRFCISTKSRESSTCVMVYNKKCKMIGRYENNRHASDVALSSDGKYLAISTLTAENATFNSVLSVYKIDGAELVYTATDRDKLPVKLFFTDNNEALLCCSDEFFLYNKKGEKKSSYFYNKDQLDGIRFNGSDLIALSFSYENSNSKSYLNIVDTSGKVIFNDLNMDKIRKMSFFDDALFVLQNDALIKISQSKVYEFILNDINDVKDIFALSESQLIISCSTHSNLKELE